IVAVVVAGGAACAARDDGAFPYQGVVEYEERDLAFEVSGRVRELAVHEGDLLQPGALIARVDPELEQSALSAREAEQRAAEQQLALLRAGARPQDVRALQARLDAARANEALQSVSAGRARRLVAGQAAARSVLDQAEAELARATADRRAAEETLQAALLGSRHQEVAAAADRAAAAGASSDLERQRVARYELRALDPAEVLEIHLRTGETALPGQPVVTVADTGHPYADVFVPQGQLGGVRVGAPARARVDALAREVIGRVERVLRRTEFAPRFIFSPDERANLVVRVRIRFDDPGRDLHAGVPLFARIDRAAVRPGATAGDGGGS
ncbi:MAG TPA: HlyD family efflux transporter periplasmic adaptor subunit, partial [Polyangia bacterium]|nr:HlyD family efflux transporter periplasmic adaptor subunit [Polyangia bacterium]